MVGVGSNCNWHCGYSDGLFADRIKLSCGPGTVESLLTAIALLGFFNILGVVFSFWKQGRRQSAVLEAA